MMEVRYAERVLVEARPDVLFTLEEVVEPVIDPALLPGMLRLEGETTDHAHGSFCIIDATVASKLHGGVDGMIASMARWIIDAIDAARFVHGTDQGCLLRHDWSSASGYQCTTHGVALGADMRVEL